MNATKIVKLYLETNGYGGLYNDAAECACKTSDLAPCERLEGGLGSSCKPGYLQDESLDDEYDFSIVEERPTSAENTCHGKQVDEWLQENTLLTDSVSTASTEK